MATPPEHMRPFAQINYSVLIQCSNAYIDLIIYVGIKLHMVIKNGHGQF